MNVQIFEKGIIDCPSCGAKWNLELYSDCLCGASIMPPNKSKKVNVKFINNPTKDWAPCGDIHRP